MTEAFLSGTEPREPCGGYFDGSQVLSIYEEPGMMSEEMAAALAAADSSMNRVEIVDDPDMAEIQEADTAIEEQIDTVLTKPPVVQPPVVQAPVVVPPPPRDTLKDSLLIR